MLEKAWLKGLGLGPRVELPTLGVSGFRRVQVVTLTLGCLCTTKSVHRACRAPCLSSSGSSSTVCSCLTSSSAVKPSSGSARRPNLAIPRHCSQVARSCWAASETATGAAPDEGLLTKQGLRDTAAGYCDVTVLAEGFKHGHVVPHARLLCVQAKSGKTAPLQSGGAFMLGGEQDCYGGCTDSGQAFYGLMDEVWGCIH